VTSFDLTGRTALVTGGTKGMGLAVARRLGEAGARVAVSGRTQESSDAAAATLPGGAIGIPADIGDEASVKALGEQALRELGHVDILIANAATEPHVGPVTSASGAAFDQTIAGVRNTLLLIEQLVPGMAGHGHGSIIVTSSIAATRASGILGVYGTSKATLGQLVRNLAQELGPKQIRVNAIAPGPVRTDFSRMLWEKPEVEAQVVARIPLGRIAEADDVAGLALLLASPAGAYITGQSIGVDGGAGVV